MSPAGDPSPGITGRTVRGAAMMLASRFLGTGIAIGATAVLARYVTPEEFGLVAMVMAILAITRVLEEFGLGDAMIQQEVISNDQISSLFWINGVVGFLLTCGFAVASPLIADFYGRDDLLMISVGLSPLFLLAGLGAQHRAVMRRAFRFRPLAIAQTSSLAVGAIGGIVAAV
ncbi:MAG: oligosaccharide flippase family protein, partial [Phycisphaerales bacterium]|nr:oligosaccharide flippase family protein [Phycisphaerales bacterium]